MADVLALFESGYFTTGLRFGVLALALGWALRFATGRFRPPMPIAGGLIATASVAGLYVMGEPLAPAVPALATIVLGVLIVRVTHAPAWVQILAAVPGAVWMAFGNPVTELMWVRVLMAVLIPVGGFLINDFETRYERLGLGVVFYTLAALGTFAAVPDTEQALVLIAAALPVTLLAWPKVAVSLGAEGSFVAVAVLLWVAAAGGGGRPPSIAGSAACLGLLLLEPLIFRIRPGLSALVNRVRQNWLGAIVASLPQLALVLICSRIAARFSVMLPALAIILVGYLLTLWFLVFLGSRTPEASEPAPSPF